VHALAAGQSIRLGDRSTESGRDAEKA